MTETESGFKVPFEHCPKCRMVIKKAEVVTGQLPPDGTALGVCIRCLQLMVVSQGRYAALTEDDAKELATYIPEPARESIYSLLRARRRLIREREAKARVASLN